MTQKLLVRDKDLNPVGIVDVEICTSKDHEVAVAFFRCYWPTGPTLKCGPCADQMAAIARAMGFPLHIEPIDYPAWKALLDPPERKRAVAIE